MTLDSFFKIIMHIWCVFCVSFGKILCRPWSALFRDAPTQKLILWSVLHNSGFGFRVGLAISKCSYLLVVIQPAKKICWLDYFLLGFWGTDFKIWYMAPPKYSNLISFFSVMMNQQNWLSLRLPKCQQDALMIVLCQYHSFSRGHLFSSSGYCHFPFQANRRRNTVFSSHTFGVRKSSRARPHLSHRNRSLFSSGWWRAGGEDLLETVANRPLFTF